MDHSSGLVFRRPQAASHRRAVVYFCSAVLTLRPRSKQSGLRHCDPSGRGMTRKLRVPKQQRAVTIEELERRVKWVGVLTPELSVEESNRLSAHRHGQTSWVPSRSLLWLWDRVDGTHGEAWVWSEFLAVLGLDREEVDQVVRDHPDQRERLAKWLDAVEAFARDRDVAPGHVGHHYQALGELGYSGEPQGEN